MPCTIESIIGVGGFVVVVVVVVVVDAVTEVLVVVVVAWTGSTAQSAVCLLKVMSCWRPPTRTRMPPIHLRVNGGGEIYMCGCEGCVLVKCMCVGVLLLLFIHKRIVHTTSYTHNMTQYTDMLHHTYTPNTAHPPHPPTHPPTHTHTSVAPCPHPYTQ